MYLPSQAKNFQQPLAAICRAHVFTPFPLLLTDDNKRKSGKAPATSAKFLLENLLLCCVFIISASENLNVGVIPGSDFRGGARMAYQQSGKFDPKRQSKAPGSISNFLALCCFMKQALKLFSDLNKSAGVSLKLYRKNCLIFLRKHASKSTTAPRYSLLAIHWQYKYYSSGSSCDMRSCSAKKRIVLSIIP